MSIYDDSYRESKQEFEDCTKGCFDGETSCRMLKLENENYRQEIYTLRHNLEISKAAQGELQEAHDFLERSNAEKLAMMEKNAQAMSEKYRESVRESGVRATELETKLAEAVLQKKELLSLLQETKLASLQSASSSTVCIEDESDALRARVKELTDLLKNEASRREILEASLMDMESRCEQLESLLQNARQHLADQAQTLESTREELAVHRTAAFSSEATNDARPPKGNSLFAEVEDRRRITLNKMSVLHEKYLSAKRECNIKAAEVKALRAVRAAIPKKWKDECSGTLADGTELINRYKCRIIELENRLKAKESKVCTKENIKGKSYLHSLLATKKKEAEELREEMDRRSAEILLLEEAKSSVEKRLRYWRYKAMSLKTEILMRGIQMQQTESANSGFLEIARDGASALETEILEMKVPNEIVKPIEDKSRMSELEKADTVLVSNCNFAAGDGTGSSCIVNANASIMHSPRSDGIGAKSTSEKPTLGETCGLTELVQRTERILSSKHVQFNDDAASSSSGKTKLGARQHQPKYPIIYVSADATLSKNE